MQSRRHILIGAGSLLAGTAAAQPGAAQTAAPPPVELPSAEERARHERLMRLAIVEAKKNPRWPFGAVIAGRDGQVLAAGVNSGHLNPMFHGEVVAMNDFVARQGNQGWAETTLYTTGEPCPMCMGAIMWAGIGTVVYGTSIATLTRHMRQIGITSGQMAEAAPFYRQALAVYAKKIPPTHPWQGVASVGLARSLVAMGELDEAETLLVAQTRNLEKWPKADRVRMVLMEGLVELYEAKEKAAPDPEDARKADEWREKLKAWRATTQPVKG